MSSLIIPLPGPKDVGNPMSEYNINRMCHIIIDCHIRHTTADYATLGIKTHDKNVANKQVEAITKELQVAGWEVETHYNKKEHKKDNKKDVANGFCSPESYFTIKAPHG